MGNLIDIIKSDVRYEGSLKACMNCGICTAICPAAEFYDYDPRRICDMVQRGDEEEVEKLLRSDTIWFCGQCMSCKPRCPRGNAPGVVINILRKVSQEMGYYKESRLGRQQVEIMENTGNNILEIGYCVHPDRMRPENHPEQGPIWDWYLKNIKDVAPKFGANYHGKGPGALREISPETMEELRNIFRVTGGMDFYDTILNGPKDDRLRIFNKNPKSRKP
jgi:heterodisulfide reductase subunit C